MPTSGLTSITRASMPVSHSTLHPTVLHVDSAHCSMEASSGSNVSAAECLSGRASQLGPTAQQQARTGLPSTHRQQMLELLQILVDLRAINQQSLSHVDRAMEHTDAAFQTGLRALQLASRVVASGGSAWVADRALSAAEIGLATAMQCQGRIRSVAGQLLQLQQRVHVQQQDLAAAARGPAVAAADDSNGDLCDTCSSVLRELADGQSRQVSPQP